MITQVEIRKSRIHQEAAKQGKERLYPAAVNASSHVALVTFLVRDLKDMLQYNNALVSEVFGQLNQHQNEEIKMLFKQSIQPLWQTFYNAAQEQKSENVHLQQEINGLKKQKSVLSQMISGTNKRVKDLGQKVGGY